MNLRWPSIFLMLGLVSMLLAVPATTFAQGAGNGGGRDQAPGQNRGTSSTTFPITTDGTWGGNAAHFTGTFHVTKFENSGGQLMAVGDLVGTLTGQTTAGNTADVNEPGLSVPVKALNGKNPSGSSSDMTDSSSGNSDGSDLQIAQVASCDILDLILGPLHLNVLGLVVDLNEVVLHITGQPGPGNLVGNLLCAITGLLDHTGTLDIITNLLNSILDILNLNL